MAGTISGQVVTTNVSVLFYVNEGNNSPYQGMLMYTPAEYAALNSGQLRAAQLQQYINWKTERDKPPHQETKEEKQARLQAVREEKSRVEQEETVLISEIEALP